MSRRVHLAVGALAAVSLILLPGCGDDGDGGDQALVVSAASSLDAAFTAYAEDAGIDAKQSFAGSDELAAQIRQGLTPDVFASADTATPAALFAEDLVERPVVFASNRLVVAVPSGSEIDALADLAAEGTTIALGEPSVPVGAYAREALDRLPAAERDAILANVRSEEPNVSGIVGKLTQDAVDAGFVYVTDVVAAGDELRSIEIPARLQPRILYAAAVVAEANEPDQASAFIDGLLDGAGAAALEEAGFGPPPGA